MRRTPNVILLSPAAKGVMRTMMNSFFWRSRRVMNSPFESFLHRCIICQVRHWKAPRPRDPELAGERVNVRVVHRQPDGVRVVRRALRWLPGRRTKERHGGRRVRNSDSAWGGTVTKHGLIVLLGTTTHAVCSPVVRFMPGTLIVGWTLVALFATRDLFYIDSWCEKTNNNWQRRIVAPENKCVLRRYYI